MRKLLSVFVIVSAFILTACGHEHTWTEATCEEPDTCSVCGEVQGEPLGHDFAPADCDHPQTCTRCGKTQGVALGHDTAASPATYQDAAVCSVCGQAVGEPLAPDFVTYGLADRMIALGESAPYVTTCYQDPSLPATGTAVVTAYETFGEDEAHEALEGYEWKKVTWEVTMSDPNAENYGFSVGSSADDYYDIKLRDDSSADTEEEGEKMFVCSWHGETYDQCMIENGIWSWGGWSDNSSITGQRTTFVRVPEGYDGVVLGLRNAGTPWPDDKYIFDIADKDTIFFRLD